MEKKRKDQSSRDIDGSGSVLIYGLLLRSPVEKLQLLLFFGGNLEK